MSVRSNNLFTLIGRCQDGMILVSTQDSDSGTDLQQYKDQSKLIIKTIKHNSPLRCTIDASTTHNFHYVIEHPCIYMTLTDKSYPKKLIYQYLFQLQQQFTQQYTSDDIARFSRPYAAIQFETTMTRTRKQYIDPNSTTNVSKLNNELNEIHSIMSQNINQVLERGEKLDTLESRSNTLRDESVKFKKYSKYVYLQQLYKNAIPVIVIIIIVLFIIWFKFIR